MPTVSISIRQISLTLTDIVFQRFSTREHENGNCQYYQIVPVPSLGKAGGRRQRSWQLQDVVKHWKYYMQMAPFGKVVNQVAHLQFRSGCIFEGISFFVEQIVALLFYVPACQHRLKIALDKTLQVSPCDSSSYDGSAESFHATNN